MATRKTIDWDSLTDEEKMETGEGLALQTDLHDRIADAIASGKNISPRLIAFALRNLYEVDIPSEILEYAADILEGKRRRGKPITTVGMTLKEAQCTFARMDFDELIDKGMTSEGAIRKLARDMFKGKTPSEDQIEITTNRISNLVYPRKRKPKGNLNRD